MDFRTILNKELENRCKKNENYSLRALSRDINIDPSNLSRILSGKVDPFKKTKERILLEIGFKPSKISKIIGKKSSENEVLKNFNNFEVDAFEVISEWHHDAILELTRLSFFKGDVKWIAKALELPELRVKIAVERLIKLGYLKIDKSGKWIDTMGDITTNLNSNYTNQSLKNRQRDILTKSKRSISNTPIEKRDHTSTMYSIDENDIDEVKKIIKKFRRKLACFLERDEVAPNQLYQLQISFFPLTKLKNKTTGE